MSLMQVLKMTLGELDYNTVMVDSLYDKNPKTNAPLLPYRGILDRLYGHLHFRHAYCSNQPTGKWQLIIINYSFLSRSPASGHRDGIYWLTVLL